MTRIECCALLFDMDGVLIDSTPAVARVWHRWASEHALNPLEVVTRAHGRPSLDTVREYLPSADHELENHEIERREMEDLDGIVLLPGARKLLNSIPSDKWTIVTSSTRPLAEVRLRAAGLPIPKHIVTSNDVQNGKPHPEPFLKAAAVLRCAADKCIVVEDAPAGVRAGKAAGSRVIAFRTTAKDEDLRRAGADWIVDNCGDISAVLENGRLFLILR